MSARRIVLVGATGTFGGRLAALLAGIEAIDLVATSRRADRAQRLADRLRAGARCARIEGAAFDSGCEPVNGLRALKPWLVIDASGPFQTAGYGVAETALRAGAHFVDIADAQGYIEGFSGALNAVAIRQNKAAFAGASSTPALSYAAVAALTQDWRRVDSIDIAITPGGKSDVGPAVMKAVLSYAGAPVPEFRDGAMHSVIGWGSLRRVVMPGLGPRFVSPVATADAAMLSRDFEVRERVRFVAGLESWSEHFGLVALAWLRRCMRLRSVTGLAPLLGQARNLTRLTTSESGGMAVCVRGLDAGGEAAIARWSLVAHENHGPYVPVLPALALTRSLLSGGLAPGARLAAGAISLAAIEAEMTGLAIVTQRDDLPLAAQARH